LDIEFHYYLTYLIAARAGFGKNDLRILAYSSQYTDDNNGMMLGKPYRVKRPNGDIYDHRISQTLTAVKKDCLAVYPLFHFVPGNPSVANRHINGAENSLVTTPDSPFANQLLDEAIQTNDFYRVGIAAHAFVDTWSHQDFASVLDSRFNGIAASEKLMENESFLSALQRIFTPGVGHGDAYTCPDIPTLEWTDPRLEQSRISNRPRVLQAAARLFGKLRRMVDPSCGDAALASDARSLCEDFETALGEPSASPSKQAEKARLVRYQNLATKVAYGGIAMPEYDSSKWFNAAARHIPKSRVAGRSSRKPSQDVYMFRDGYTKSDWFLFQEAVKAHAEFAEEMMKSVLV
jgi:hypothetical protein